PWAAVSAAALAAGDPVPGARRLHDVLAAPDVSRRRLLEISRHPPFIRGRRLDLGSALSSREPRARHYRGRRRVAVGGYFADRDAVAWPVQYLPFGLRPRQSQLGPRPVQVCDCNAGLPSLASYRA